MISAWTKHLKEQDEVDHFKNTLLGSKTVLNRMSALLDEMKTDIDNTEVNLKIYETPNWDHKQAHLNGFKDCLKKIQKLITLDGSQA